MNSRFWLVAAAIAIVAGVFRITNLGSVPQPSADEVLAAVDLHYVLTTGHHFTGATPGILAHVIPILDGRYLVSMFSSANVGDLRLISALFGIATVCLMFPLCAELGIPKLGPVAAAGLAIMPWHIYFSRLFFPGSEYLFLSVLSLVLLLAGLRRGTLLLLLASALTAVASVYLYPISIVTTPLFSVGVAVFRWSELRRLSPFKVFAPLALSAIAMAPYLADHLAATDAVVANQNSVIGLKMVWNHGLGPLDGSLLFLQNWAAYLNPQFLFFHGDPNPSQSVQIIGAVGWLGGLLGVIGIIVSPAKLTRLHLLLLYWLVAYPVADALTYYDATGNSLRGLLGCVVWALLGAVGVSWLYALHGHGASWLTRAQQLRRPLVGLLVLATAVQSIVFLSSYWGSYNASYGYLFETGYDRIYQAINARGLAGVSITLHAGYQRNAMLEYFSNYRMHAAQSLLACYDLPHDVIATTALPRVFVVKDDPGFAAMPDCVHGDLVGRDKATLEGTLIRPAEPVRKMDVIDEFALDHDGKFHAAIFYLHY